MLGYRQIHLIVKRSFDDETKPVELVIGHKELWIICKHDLGIADLQTQVVAPYIQS